MEQATLNKLHDITENVFNITRPEYPANKSLSDVTDFIKQLVTYRTLLTNLSKDEKFFESLSDTEKKEVNFLNIYTFFLKMVQDTYQNTIETMQALFITQFMVAKRINDLEEIIQELQNVFNNQIAINTPNSLLKKQATDVLNSPAKAYPAFALQALTLLEIFYGEKDKTALEHIQATEDDLEEISDYADEINNFAKIIDENIKSGTAKWEYNILNLENIKPTELFEGKDNADVLTKNFIDIAKMYQSAPSEVHHIIIEQYKIEYVGILMCERVLELEMILQEYLINIDNL